MVNAAVTDTAWSPNYTRGRPQPPRCIVIHHWGEDGQSHQDVLNYLCTPRGEESTSAHYVASAGRVTQLVADTDMAWHAGTDGNPAGIGIECRPEMTAQDVETVARLVAAIRAEWGPLPLHGHRDYMPTACPGRWYANLARLAARAVEYQTGRATYTKPTHTLPAPPPRRETEMLMIHRPNAAANGKALYAIVGPRFFLAFTGQGTANAFARQIGANSVEVTDAFWEHCRRAAMEGTNLS